jgi:opacity protein-like surface antigen
MVSFFKSAMVGAVAMVVSGAAFAAPSMMSPVPVADWSGFYAGIHGGFGSGTPSTCVKSNQFNSSGYPCSDWTGEPGVSGGYFGGQIGYNWMLQNSLLFGVEADASWAGIDGSGSETFNPGFAIHSTGKYSIDWLGTVRGRLGYVMGDWMPYFTAGVAFGGGTRTTNVVGGEVSASATHTGWTAGLGVEWAFKPTWTLKAEYKYVDLGSANYSYPTIVHSVLGIDHTLNTFEIGLNHKF